MVTRQTGYILGLLGSILAVLINIFSILVGSFIEKIINNPYTTNFAIFYKYYLLIGGILTFVFAIIMLIASIKIKNQTTKTPSIILLVFSSLSLITGGGAGSILGIIGGIVGLTAKE